MASVLKIRDKNGGFFPINALRGTQGKSAYEQAKEGGYTGTEEEFIALLNGILASSSSNHTNNTDNPHEVTAEQTGAIPEVCHLSTNLDNELQQGGNKMTVCFYNGQTLNSPYDLQFSNSTHGMVITNACSSERGTQLCMPSGEGNIYVRELTKYGPSDYWAKMAINEALHHGGAVGYCVSAYDGGAVGYCASAYDGGAVGYGAETGDGFAGGKGAKTIATFDDGYSVIHDGIQLGTGTNGNDKTLQVYDYQLMDAGGKIPIDRLPISTGTYEGSGNDAVRTIDTGVDGTVLVITGGYGVAFVTQHGAIVKGSGSTTLAGLADSAIKFVDGVLTIATKSNYVNSGTYSYKYQVLLGSK